MAQNLPFANLMAMARKPHLATCAVFSATHDLSWIPDSTLNFVVEDPLLAANGTRFEFTFGSLPKAVLYNGEWRFENAGYTRVENTITLTDENGDTLTPESGAVIQALV
jgi:hypothetical protein